MSLTQHATADPTPATGPDGPICATTELPTAWCGHCRFPHAGHTRMRDRLSRRARLRAVPLSHTLTARYGGECEQCDMTYHPGELIGATVEGSYICSECAQ